jgi:inorganic pyrophosphatase
MAESNHAVDLVQCTVPGIVAGIASCAFAFVQYKRVEAKPVGKDIDHPLLDKLAEQIKTGSAAFLREEYKYLAGFVVVLGIFLFIVFAAQNADGDGGPADGGRVVMAFITGAILSGLSGWLGMTVATLGNVRTTVACTGTKQEPGSLNAGLKVAFTTGTVMGFMVVGLGLAGVCIIFLILQSINGENGLAGLNTSVRNLSAFGFGASSIALFARVAGGIYTKAADVGADLVGKVESGIDEDDPHNPAVIADNVGDNVGDVAGMGADLFESYVGSLIAAMSIAAFEPESEVEPKTLLPIWLSAAGIACSMVGVFFVSTTQKGEGWKTPLGALMFALEKGIYSACVLFIGSAVAICVALFPPVEDAITGEIIRDGKEAYRILGCIVLGLVCGVIIGKATEYFTSFDFGPTMSITHRGVTGPATVVIQGMGVGMISCLPTTFLLVATILSCSALGDAYGVAISAVGMLATLGITLATDAYGPVADNAGGLAEMDQSIPKEVRGRTDALDALGNTTAATGKGFAIGSAVLTSLSLVQAFKQRVDPTGEMSFSVDEPIVLAGVLLGAMMPMLFAALTMISVGKAAAEIIIEVRRQFHGDVDLGIEPVPGLFECIQKASNNIPIPPDEDVMPLSDRCVAISTRSSVREMIAPGLYAILFPLMVGFLVGPRCLMGLLAGAIAAGCMLAIMMSNAGGAWDNSKKLCEKWDLKKTEQGKACVVGDTVGDPFKDTSGPSLNILIKLMSMVSLTLSPMVEGNQDWDSWQWGLIPVGIGLLAFVVLVYKGILGWQDPLADLVSKGNSPKGTGGKKQEGTSLMTADRRGSSDSNFSGGRQIQSL